MGKMLAGSTRTLAAEPNSALQLGMQATAVLADGRELALHCKELLEPEPELAVSTVVYENSSLFSENLSNS
jgi:hypothetical protein